MCSFIQSATSVLLFCYNASSESHKGPRGDRAGNSVEGRVEKKNQSESLRWEERLLGDLRGATVVTSWNTSKQGEILGFSTGTGTHSRIHCVCFHPTENCVERIEVFLAAKECGLTIKSFSPSATNKLRISDNSFCFFGICYINIAFSASCAHLLNYLFLIIYLFSLKSQPAAKTAGKLSKLLTREPQGPRRWLSPALTYQTLKGHLHWFSLALLRKLLKAL